MSDIPVFPIYKCSRFVKFFKSFKSEILFPYIVKSFKLVIFFIGEISVIQFLLKFNLVKFSNFSNPEISFIFLEYCKYVFDKSNSVIESILLIFKVSVSSSFSSYCTVFIIKLYKLESLKETIVLVSSTACVFVGLKTHNTINNNSVNLKYSFIFSSSFVIKLQINYIISE